MSRAPRHIAIVRFSAMGDVAMLFPVLRAVLSQNELQITLFTRPQFIPIFSSIKGLNVQAVDLKNKHSGPLGLWRLAREIKSMGPDYFLDLHDVLRTKLLRTFMRLLGVAVHTFDKGRAQKKQRVKDFDPKAPWLMSTHERYADGFRALGLMVNLDLGLLNPIKNDALDKNQTTGVLEFLNSVRPQNGALIGLAPFAAYPGKTYPLDLAGALCEQLTKKGHQVLLFGAPGKEARQLKDRVQSIKGTAVLAGQWTFAQELEIMSHLDLMIAMDSGNGHLAANFGIPVLTLWGATHPSLGFMPFGQSPERQLYADRSQYPKLPTSVYGNKLPEGYSELMRSIPVGDILLKVQEILA